MTGGEDSRSSSSSRVDSSQRLRTAVSIFFNILASVSLILANKRLVFYLADYNFGTALTMIHFMWTFFLCCLFGVCGFFEAKYLNFIEVLKISAAFSGYILFQNMSLVYNSVGFYQIMKIVNTPTILVLEWYLYQKKQSFRILACLFVVCLGIFVTVFTDTHLNFWGSVHACIAVFFNSLYTIWGKHKQDELKCNSAQLLFWQAPTATVMLIVPLTMDRFDELLKYKYTATTVVTIGTSCVLAGMVNFSFFWMVGRTSPLTANVVGYVKTVLVFIGGFILFRDSLTVQNTAGILVTLLGSALYMYVQHRQSAAKESSSSSSTATTNSSSSSSGGGSGGSTSLTKLAVMGGASTSILLPITPPCKP